MIVATGLSREFQRADGQLVQALAEVSFAIERGQFVCIVGPSGCGKSTLLQMIAGLLLPSAGTIAVNGAPVTGPGPERGMVFQKDSVFPWLRVIRNVEYGLKCRGVDKAERRRIAGLYLERVGLVARGLGLAARALRRHAEARRGRHGVRQRRRGAAARRAVRRRRLRHQAAAARGPADALVGGRDAARGAPWSS